MRELNRCPPERYKLKSANPYFNGLWTGSSTATYLALHPGDVLNAGSLEYWNSLERLPAFLWAGSQKPEFGGRKPEGRRLPNPIF